MKETTRHVMNKLLKTVSIWVLKKHASKQPMGQGRNKRKIMNRIKMKSTYQNM